jgi:hypothetical protein
MLSSDWPVCTITGVQFARAIRMPTDENHGRSLARSLCAPAPKRDAAHGRTKSDLVERPRCDSCCALKGRILGRLAACEVHGAAPASPAPPQMADFALWETACETAFWPAGDRGLNRRRSSSRSGARDYGQPQHVDGKCFGSPACRCSPGGSRPPERGRGLAEESAGTRWPPASRADVPSGPGHRHCLQS